MKKNETLQERMEGFIYGLATITFFCFCIFAFIEVAGRVL